MSGIHPDLDGNQGVVDVLVERTSQIENDWDERNKGLVLDQYLGISIAYLGRATCSYRNDPAAKRAMIVKAAAMLLQTIDRIDDGSLDLGVPMGIAMRNRVAAEGGTTTTEAHQHVDEQIGGAHDAPYTGQPSPGAAVAWVDPDAAVIPRNQTGED